MKYNKGFATLILVAIIAGALVIGGGAYYLGKNSNNKEVKLEEKNILQENQIVNDSKKDCLPTTPPFIKILSPIGGESYIAGQEAEINWKSCNISDETNMSIFLDGFESMNSPYRWNALATTGSYTWTVPDMSFFKTSTSFGLGFNAGGIHASSGIFTINSPKISTTLPAKYVGAQEGWPPVIKHIQGVYSCNVGTTNPDINEKTVQKTINSRKYCIKSSSEGAAGSSYLAYTYTTTSLNGNGLETTSFVLRFINCGGYGGPDDTQHKECKKTQTDFTSNLDNLIDSLMSK